MGLMSKIAKSSMGEFTALAMGIGASVITPEMLTPPTVYAQQQDYGQLIEQIKQGSSAPPLRIRKGDGTIDTIVGYTRSGYNAELKNIVDFAFYPVGNNGILITKIKGSTIVPDDVSFGEGRVSIVHRLVVVEGTDQPIDGNPEQVGVEKSQYLLLSPHKQPTPEFPASVKIETEPLDTYRSDPNLKKRVDAEYFKALNKTTFSK